MPVKCAGTRTDPPPSLPMPPAEHPAAIAADSPPLEPPGVRPGSHGLHVRPCSGFSVSYPISMSATFVVPSTTAPAARIRATTTASRWATIPFREGLPVSQRRPVTSIALFTVTGRPPRGPRGAPVAARASCARASARAWSVRTSTNAFKCGSIRSICSRCAVTRSTADMEPAATRRTSSVAGSCRSDRIDWLRCPRMSAL